MPIFSYTAKDLHGQYHKGEVETVDERQAAALLRKKRLIIISIKPINKSNQKFWDKILNHVPFTDVVVMTRQLATMVGAGLVLSEALDILQDQQTNKRFKEVLSEISNDVKGGVDFATALEKHPDVFPNLYSKLVRAGQASGKLDTILIDLANNLEKDRQFKSKVKSAMIYPIIVVFMMVGVMLVMIFFVIPRLLGLYKESGIELPIMTKIMIAFAEFMLGYWWAILIAVIMGVLSFKKYISSPSGSLNFDTFLLKLPVVGKITQTIILTSFVRTFALLISSGVSILDAIKITSNVVGNHVFRNTLEESYKGVERGLSFSSQLLATPAFPKIVGQMVKTGEETGKLDEVLFKLADYFESESDEALKNVTTLIEPIILVILGIGVAFLVVSIILPIYQLTTSIGS